MNLKILALVAFMLTLPAHSQTCPTAAPGPGDALIASPANHTLLYEDADVRVLDVHSQPHTREAVHTHRLPSVMYIERQGAGTYDTPDGTDHRSHPTDPNFKPRAFAIKSEGPHWTENTGDVPFHAIRVEFKHPGCGLDGWKPGQPSPYGQKPLFENDEVRVLDVVVAPHSKETKSADPWPSIVYITAGEKISTDKIVQNPGNTQLHLIRFELKYGSGAGH